MRDRLRRGQGQLCIDGNVSMLYSRGVNAPHCVRGTLTRLQIDSRLYCIYCTSCIVKVHKSKTYLHSAIFSDLSEVKKEEKKQSKKSVNSFIQID